MWITFSLFLQYKVRIVLTMTRAFRWYPICRSQLDQSGPDSNQAITWAWATLQLVIRELQYVLQYIVIEKIIAYKQLILVFLLYFQYFSSLSTKHNWHHNFHNHGRHWRKCPPSAPHEALHSVPMLWMDGQQPSELADVFFGEIEGVYGPQSAPLFQRWCIATTSGCFEGHTLPQQPQNLYLHAWGVVAHPFNALAQSTRPHVGH